MPSQPNLEIPRRTRRIRLAQFGLGAIGIEALRLAASKPWIEIVGAIDSDPAKHGQTLGQLAGGLSGAMRGGMRVAPNGGQNEGSNYDSFPIHANFADLKGAAARPDVVLHTAGSKARDAFAQMGPMIRAGVSVVSSCEQLLFPQLRHPAESQEFDNLCRHYGAGVVGTGVNPGFVMDVLPICPTGVSRSVNSIHVQRQVNASTRRMQLQKKIGSGMKPDDFRALFAAGEAGHAGFRESAALVCHCMKWPVDRIEETCEPVIATRDIRTQFFTVARGLTCGLHQTATAHVSGMGTPLMMDLKMFLDAPDPHDAIQISGEPPLDVRLNGGGAGDSATVAALINVIPRLLKAGPGLHLMTDLTVPAFA